MAVQKILVEHPGQHYATAKQLKDAGVDPDEATGYINESGVGTTYSFDDEKIAASEAPEKNKAQPNTRTVADESGKAQPA
jgi:hypothetical protein